MILEEKIEILEEKIKILERKIEDLEGIECIGCKKKYADTDELPLCDICEHPVCYSCIQEGPGCPRKICAIIYQMLKDTKTD
jgi:hypothetical protein